MEGRTGEEGAGGVSPERIEEARQRFIAFQRRRIWDDKNEMLAMIKEIYEEHVSMGLVPDLRGRKNKPEPENT